MSVSILCAALAFTVLAIGCGGESNAPQLETATSGTFEFVADEELRPAIDSLVAGFMSENKRAKVTVRYTSAGQAVEDLLNEKTRLVIVARFLSPLERQLLTNHNLSLPEYDIAQNAVACIVSAKNALTEISWEDLEAVVRNDAKQWSDLKTSSFEGGRGGPIIKCLPPFHSSTEYLLDTLFLQPNAVQQGTIRRFTTTDSIIAQVRNEPNAIGFIGSSWLQRLEKQGDTTIKAIPIIPKGGAGDGQAIMLHLAYVHQGLYPLTNRVNGYTFDSPNTLPRGLLAYAMTSHGQAVFKNHNILPRTQIIRIVPNRR
jgi:phosphate transport system substrate-binding protein